MRRLVVVAVLIGADATTILTTAGLAVWIRRAIAPLLPGVDAFSPVTTYLTLWPALLALILARLAVGLYPGYGLHPAEDLKRQTHVTGALLVAILGAGTLFQFAEVYSRIVLVLTGGLLLLTLPLARSLAKARLARTRWYGERAWLVGHSARAKEVASSITNNPELGLVVVGTGPLPARSQGLATCIVVPEGIDRPLSELLDELTDSFQRVWLVPELLDVSSVWVSPRDIQGHLALELRNNLLEKRNQITKRVLDIALAVASLPLAVPLAAIISLAIALESRGPVVFTQTRLGRNGKPFEVYKFRTMHLAAEERLAVFLERDPAAKEEWLRTRKLARDPRVTRVGRFLRRSSLDELPQLLNVLRGEMSFVGPRPVMPDEVQWYGDNARHLARVRPGLTGLTQVSGRSLLAYEDRVRIDTYYVRNWSIWLDIVILSRTLGSVVRGTGAF